MSALYSTKGGRYKKRWPLAHPDVHGDIVDVPQSSVMGDSPVSERSRTSSIDERRGATFLGYKKYRDDEEIPEVTYLPNAHGLGTPMEAARARAMRLERLWQRVFRYGGAIIVILVAMGGYGYIGRHDKPPVSGDVAYYVKAQSLRVGQRACELDQHEGCLVCMHKDVDGVALVSHHC